MKSVPKAWGREDWIVEDDKYFAKYLHITPGWRCSSHSHPIKKETFVVVEGACFLEIDGEEHIARLGDGKQYVVEPNQVHWFGVPNKWAPCVLLEVSTHHDDQDVKRISPSRHFEE